MTKFKQKGLIAALAAAGTFAMSNAANAVYVNQDGLGEALIYSYYTVRGGNSTLLSVVNTTNQGKIVKVRFREGKNSADVLDFLVFLSEKDVWTASVTNSAINTGGVGGAVLKTGDTSCVYPTTDEFGNNIRGGGIPFRSFDFTGSKVDGETTAIDRVREGYVEMIEIATVPTNAALYKDIVHNSGSATAARTPLCKTVNAGSTVYGAKAVVAELTTPSGGLFGNGTIINPDGGTNTGYDAIALDDFWAPNATPIVGAPSNPTPNLGSANPVSVVTSGNVTYVSDWQSSPLPGWDAVSAALMHANVMNEYAYTADNVFATDWVITMPTKRPYVNTGSSSATAPFQRVFEEGGACDDIVLTSYDREEGTRSTPEGFSPPQVGGVTQLCWEANVISFGGSTGTPSSVLGSTNNLGFAGFQNNGNPVPSPGAAPQGEGGWLDLTFAVPGAGETYHTLAAPTTTTVTINGVQPPAIGTSTNTTYVGLPAVGFAVVQANIGTKASFASSYGHRYKRTITQPLLTQ